MSGTWQFLRFCVSQRCQRLCAGVVNSYLMILHNCMYLSEHKYLLMVIFLFTPWICPSVSTLAGSQMPDQSSYRPEVHWLVSNHSRALCWPVGLVRWRDWRQHISYKCCSSSVLEVWLPDDSQDSPPSLMFTHWWQVLLSF